MTDAPTIYFDYTCRFSYRAVRWFDSVPDLKVRWATFSLKEVNRHAEDPPVLDPDSPPSVSILALALSHAARDADFGSYHHAVFDAMHREERKVGHEDLFEFAADAGVDVGAFQAIQGSWVSRVRDEHYDGVERWGVYGTPTFLLGSAAAYVRLQFDPAAGEDPRDLLEALNRTASASVDLVELFRPEGPTLNPVTVHFEPPKGVPG